ncbi:DUF2789 family protein [Neptunomonas antarctica]|uniref:DUF2789 domain-containing protein n=1 Tax=Neptunomonas antarctica TaxID=619304 RepID=A0A1N7M472_9GAMM|nr:DUF2789 family protein [Neptunomonas antarctica]SIS80888.1 Protein of unknown function [Neptunomonas antarctica]
MDTVKHNFENLFLQLGLSVEGKDIETFIQQHVLDAETALEDASFWSPGQSAFIKESRANDADWSEMVDALDSLLRKKR